MAYAAPVSVTTAPARPPGEVHEQVGVSRTIASIENAALLAEAARPPERRGTGAVAGQADQRLGDLGRDGRAGQDTGLAVGHQLPDAADVRRHHRADRRTSPRAPTSADASTALVRQTTSAACMMSSASAR